MDLWFHIRHLPKWGKLHKTGRMATPKYAWTLQQERDYLTGLTMALAQLVDALGDEIAELQEAK